MPSSSIALLMERTLVIRTLEPGRARSTTRSMPSSSIALSRMLDSRFEHGTFVRNLPSLVNSPSLAPRDTAISTDVRRIPLDAARPSTPTFSKSFAPVAHAVGGKHVSCAVGGAVAAEATSAQRMVHVEVRLHELDHGGRALLGGNGHHAVVRFLDHADVKAGLFQHLAAERASLAVRALHLLVGPTRKHAERRIARLVDFGQLVCGHFPHPRLSELPRLHKPTV